MDTLVIEGRKDVAAGEPPNADPSFAPALRPHYAETLRQWLSRFEAAAGTVRLLHGESPARDLPRTRAALYRDEARPARRQ